MSGGKGQCALVNAECQGDNFEIGFEGLEHFFGLCPGQSELAPCDGRELVEYLHADDAATGDDGLGFARFGGVTGHQVDDDIGVEEWAFSAAHWLRAGRT